MKFTVLPVHFKKYTEYIEKHHSILIQIWTFSPVFNCSAIFFLQVDKCYLNYSPYFLRAREAKVLKGLVHFGEVSWKTTKSIPTFPCFISPPRASGNRESRPGTISHAFCRSRRWKLQGTLFVLCNPGIKEVKSDPTYSLPCSIFVLSCRQGKHHVIFNKPRTWKYYYVIQFITVLHKLGTEWWERKKFRSKYLKQVSSANVMQ